MNIYTPIRPAKTGFRGQFGREDRTRRAQEAIQGLPPGKNRAALTGLLRETFRRFTARYVNDQGEVIIERRLDRQAVAIVEALIWSGQEADWSGGRLNVSWMSNRELEKVTGLGLTQTQQRLRDLVNVGWISGFGDGRRWGRRDDGNKGAIIAAVGFDLSPLAARYDELEALAEQLDHERAEERILRTEIQRLKAEARRCAADAILNEIEGYDWQEAHAQSCTRTPKSASLDQIRAIHDACKGRLDAMLSIYRAATVQTESNSSEPQGSEIRTPITVANQDITLKASTYQAIEKQVAGICSSTSKDSGSDDIFETLPPSLVIQAVPELGAYMEGKPSPTTIIAAAKNAAHELGIWPSTFAEACRTMGAPYRVAVAVAITLARDAMGEINSTPEYYFARGLVAKARTGELNLLRSLYGLASRPSAAAAHKARATIMPPKQSDEETPFPARLYGWDHECAFVKAAKLHGGNWSIELIETEFRKSHGSKIEHLRGTLILDVWTRFCLAWVERRGEK